MLGRMASGTEQLGVARTPPLARPLAIGAVVALLLVGAWYLIQLVILEYTAAAALGASVEHVDAALRPETPIQVSANGAGVELLDARLFRAELDSRSSEQPVPVRLQPTDTPGNWDLTTTTGAPLLMTDGSYRLVVRASAPRPALPLPRTDVFEQQHRFTTVASPRLQAPSETLAPRWGDPVSVTWSHPMHSVSATSMPPASVRAWIDPQDAARTWVHFDPTSVVDGQTYQVTLSDARSVDGLDLRQPASFEVAIPPRPSFVEVPTAPVTLARGQTLTLKSSMPLADARVSTSGALAGQVQVERDQVVLSLPDFAQGAELELRVDAAVSPLGAPMLEPVRVRVLTPPALSEPEVAPADGASGVQPATRPSITFAQPIADRDAVVGALSIEPAVEGQWEWTSPQTVEFVPLERLPTLTDIAVTLRGGPDGPRTAAGGFLEGDRAWSFKTTDYKRIDVNLARQVMTLYEDEVAVRSIMIATGVAGAQTPTGNYQVQYKMPQARFQGVNPSGARYDIPDVNWVLAFFGDYTIHGAHWRSRFGAPGSNGCVSMTDADAKVVYDWADIGTPITIHS